MTVRFTPQGCKVEKTFGIMLNGVVHEKIVLSVDPASMLAIETEENAGKSIGERTKDAKAQMRVRATKYGFELVERR